MKSFNPDTDIIDVVHQDYISVKDAWFKTCACMFPHDWNQRRDTSGSPEAKNAKAASDKRFAIAAEKLREGLEKGKKLPTFVQVDRNDFRRVSASDWAEEGAASVTNGRIWGVAGFGDGSVCIIKAYDFAVWLYQMFPDVALKPNNKGRPKGSGKINDEPHLKALRVLLNQPGAKPYPVIRKYVKNNSVDGQSFDSTVSRLTRKI
ncbi:MAG: hypothetical protein HON65_11645 [Rhodospirillales bacterium]|jgi:hypothetical protein|nr:hypothetical protein [Rhodospirillales bacterium]